MRGARGLTRKAIRMAAAAVLLVVFSASLGARWIAAHPYSEQDRRHPNAPPSWQLPLGADELGRDRFSRLLYGGRVSLLLAPAAALTSTLLALIIGGIAGFAGGACERAATSIADLFMAAPTIMVLLTVRALLPLNVSPWTSILITCALLGCLGWAHAARVVRTRVAQLLASDFITQARACGATPARTFLAHIAPNLRPVIVAQFWIAVPAFVLSEANLGLLGLGVAEPMPSWGNMLRELENYAAIPERPWILAPAAALMLVVICLHLVLPAEDAA
jgi:peptide/nickel transport system permease protein